MNLQKQRNEIRRNTAVDFINYGKIPPQAIEIEKAILGAIMIERSAYDTASEILKPESFYSEAHKKIFEAMRFLDSNQQPIDILTVIEALKIQESLDLVGGPYYLTELTKDVVSAANIEIHCRIVLEKYILREMIRMSGETIEAAYSDSSDFHEVMELHERTLNEITTGTIQSNFKKTDQIGSTEINRLYHLHKNPTSLTGVDTGYSILNHITGGWQPTDLIILAGRPSVGKTAMSLNFLRNAALSVPVGMFNLEMGDSQLMRRLLCSESKIYLDKFNNGKMSIEEIEATVMANDRLNRLKIYIDDTGGIDIYELRSKARRMVSKYGVKLIVIDYLQLMSGEGANREQEVSGISRRLKALAKELKVPLIVLSQLNRASETAKREPMLSDLRESGAIEQDADMVMFAWRDDYQVIEQGEAQNTAYLKIAKHRNGALDKLAFRTDMRVQQWFDLTGWDQYSRNNPF